MASDQAWTCSLCGWAQAKLTIIVITCEVLAGSLGTGAGGGAQLPEGRALGWASGLWVNVQTAWTWVPVFAFLTLGFFLHKMKGLAQRTSEGPAFSLGLYLG